MGALKQYTDLYRQHFTLVNENSCHILNSQREIALKILEESGLPKVGSENYEITDLNEMLSPDYGLNLARIDINVNPTAAFRCGVPNLSTSVFFLNNDLYSEAEGARNNLPEGVYIGSLKEFCQEMPHIASKYYGQIADIKNPIVALDTLFTQDGIAIYVPEGTKVTNALQIVGTLQNGRPLMAVRRFLIILEKGAELKILYCDHTQKADENFLNLQTLEVIVGENASLDLYDLEETSEYTSRLSSLYSELGKGSKIVIDGITLYNGKTRNEYFCNITGEGAELKLFGLGIEDKQRKLDIFSRVTHKAPGCHTDELFKFVLDDNSKGAFSGLIKVEKGASKTEAFQSNRNIVGSKEAKMFSKPQLEIYDDDVKCSHGCAIGQLDEKQVFYMQTRGIPENEAKFLLKQAFMADVIEAVRIQSLKERLHMLVEKRFAGENLSCHNCSAFKSPLYKKC